MGGILFKNGFYDCVNWYGLRFIWEHFEIYCCDGAWIFMNKWQYLRGI